MTDATAPDQRYLLDCRWCLWRPMAVQWPHPHPEAPLQQSETWLVFQVLQRQNGRLVGFRTYWVYALVSLLAGAIEAGGNDCGMRLSFSSPSPTGG
jgi:hypothetical protein